MCVTDSSSQCQQFMQGLKMQEGLWCTIQSNGHQLSIALVSSSQLILFRPAVWDVYDVGREEVEVSSSTTPTHC